MTATVFALLALVGVTATATGQEDNATGGQRFQLLNNCAPMRLIVETLDEDAAAIGLTTESLQLAAESRLRSARLFTVNSGAPTFLYVTVNALSPAHSLARIIRGGLDSDTSGVWKVAGVGLRWT